MPLPFLLRARRTYSDVGVVNITSLKLGVVIEVQRAGSGHSIAGGRLIFLGIGQFLCNLLNNSGAELREHAVNDAGDGFRVSGR